MLVALVAALETIGLLQACRRLATDPARLKPLLRALAPIAVLALLVVASLVLGFFTIGYRAFLMGPFASDGLAGMQPRYLFPHLLVALGLVTAIARTFLDGETRPVALAAAPRGRGVRGALLGVFALTLLSLEVHLATAVLARYY